MKVLHSHQRHTEQDTVLADRILAGHTPEAEESSRRSLVADSLGVVRMGQPMKGRMAVGNLGSLKARRKDR